jgi:hypothetical protein
LGLLGRKTENRLINPGDDDVQIRLDVPRDRAATAMNSRR